MSQFPSAAASAENAWVDSPASANGVASPARERELTRRRGIDPVTSGVRRWRCEGLPLSCFCLRVFARSILRSRRPAPKPMRPAFQSACVFTASSPTLTAATPPYLNATPQRRVAGRNVSSIPTPLHTSRAPASPSAPRGTGGIDTISSQIAPVNRYRQQTAHQREGRPPTDGLKSNEE